VLTVERVGDSNLQPNVWRTTVPTAQWTRADRTRRLGATTLVSAATAAALLGLDGTASAAMPSEQTMRDVPEEVDRGTRVTFRGTLTGGAGDHPLAGEKVDLERNAGSGWSTTDSARTDADGRVSIPVRVGETAEFRLTYRGDELHDGDNSAKQQVEVERPVNERIVEAAAAQEGDPYEYGADGPDSFDCSGLTQYAHKQVGIELPRTSDQQRDAVEPVDREDMRPGDLLFFDGHVGIYAGDGRLWQSPQEGESVEKVDIWTDDYTVGRAW